MKKGCIENTDIRHYEAEYLHVRHYQYDGRIYLVATEGNISNRVTEKIYRHQELFGLRQELLTDENRKSVKTADGPVVYDMPQYVACYLLFIPAGLMTT
ncbi:hypothetical protein DY703_07625 [Salmonella enterica]|nr:hypothetical protein [Salmonella enterica]EBQ9480104.1 hypothetical protein [Salmonella enterica subsp. enterica serovar Kokomlemle]ECS5198546.1 hypothetical protein [Salmonella enterica subsp. enterica serovar Poano]